jgi:hypothetical protein
MKELRTEIEIQASPEKVWQVLTELDKYPEWNPFIHHAIGRATVGKAVDIDFQPDSTGMKLHCTVVKAEPNKTLTWRYHVGADFLFNGEHSFSIEPIDERHVRFVDKEVFNGLLVPLQAKDIDTNSKRGFEAMDQALKARVEHK